MKNLILLIGSVMLLSLPLSALVQLGNGDVYIEGDVNFEYDSNLFLRENNAIDDFLMNYYAGVGFIQKEHSVLNVELELGLEVDRFFDYTAEDSEDWKSSFLISYPNNVERQGFFSLGAGWNEDTQSNADIGQRIESEIKDVDVRLHQSISDKSGVEFSAGFADEEYKNGVDPRSGFSLNRSSEDISLSALAFYQYSEKLSAIFTYAYQDISYSDNVTAGNFNTLAVGIRGEISPKVTGSISIGLRDSDLTGSSIVRQSNTDPFYSVDLAWAPSEKTIVAFSGSSGVQTSVYGDVNERNDFQVQINEKLSDKSSLRGGFVYSENDYKGLFDRVDESIILFGGYFYDIDGQSSINVRASIEDRSSTLDGLGFDRVVIRIGYTGLF